MPRKITKTSQNKETLLKILEYKEQEKTYEEIASLLNLRKDFVYELVKTYKKEFNLSSVITKYDILKIKNEISNIIQFYNQGLSIQKIGEKYNVTDVTVASWLRKENIKIREVGKISKTNQTMFDSIDTELKAYVLGLITADGSVSTHGEVTICLTENDGYLLELINKKLFDNSGSIFVTHQEDEKPRKCLRFCGKQIIKKLSEFDIVPNKTYSISSLSPKIPFELYHHYIRGLFDGDGVCSFFTDKQKKQKVRIGYCAHNRSFTESFRDFLNREIGLPKNKLFNTGGCWQCSWSSFKDVKSFYDYIYKDATIFLGRKKKKISDYVNTEVN